MEPKSMRVVPRWLVVIGVLVILGIVVFGLARIILPMQQASDSQITDTVEKTDSNFVDGKGKSGNSRQGPVGFIRNLFGDSSEDDAVETGEVILLTAERKIDTSGILTAAQSGDIYWETSGIVDDVLVSVGDNVKKGDVMLKLDPLSAPQNVILAQADLISARNELDDLLNPTGLQISNAKRYLIIAEDNLESLLKPSQTDVALARQAVSDAQEAFEELLSPTSAAIASAEQRFAIAKDTLRDKEEELDSLLNPDIESLQDELRDAEFDLLRAEQDVELADIGSATSSLDNAREHLNNMKERQLKIQKAIDGCIVNIVENDNDDDTDYMHITVNEETEYGGYTYMVGPVYQVFEETGEILKDTYGSVVEQMPIRICDTGRAVTVDGVSRTVTEVQDDVFAAQERVREAELQLERTRMSNTTALDLANEKVVEAQEALDDALDGVDLIDLELIEAEVEDAKADVVDADNDLVTLLNPLSEDLDVSKGNLSDAQDALDKLLTPESSDVELAQARVIDAEEKLSELINGPSEDDIAVAEARVTAAEATLKTLWVEAPFDGQVIDINYQSGDSTDQLIYAVKLANINELLVEVSVDETEVSNIKLGQIANLSFDAIPFLEIPALVTKIAPFGETVQGLVRYPVTVTLSEKPSSVMLGMTSYVKIITEVQNEALAVPIDAIKFDDEGEYVMVFNESSNQQRRVSVESGIIQGDQVVVTGDLTVNQKVVIFVPKPTDSGNPFERD